VGAKQVQRKHLVAVWNPSYGNAMDATIEMLLSHARSAPSRSKAVRTVHVGTCKLNLRALALLTTVAVACTRPVRPSQSTPSTCLDSAGFVRTIGKDTLDLENVRFDGHDIYGVQWTPDGTRGYQLSFDDSLIATEGEFFIWAGRRHVTLDPTQDARYRLVGDTAIFGVKGDKGMQIQRNRIQRNAAVMLDLTVGLDEILTRRARRSGKASIDIPTFFVATGGYSPVAHIRFIGKDSAQIRFGADGEVAELIVDPVGRIRRAYYRMGAADTVSVVNRVPCGELEPILLKRTGG
jgi:hypothetical protein